MEDARLASEFTELYRGHYGRVLRYIARRVGPGDEPEDLTAEVFRIAWDRVQNGDQLAPAWLFGTARKSAPESLAGRGAGHPIASRGNRRAAFSTAEIAAHLALSSSAVWVRLHRARRAFQEAFIEAATSGVTNAHD
jgi:RNA polymerase sigma-70 factor (ECF subfamily)